MNEVELQLAYAEEILTGYYMQKRLVPRYIAGALADTLIKYQLEVLQRNVFNITFPGTEICVKLKNTDSEQ